MAILGATQWDQFIAGHANSHILQTTAWGDLKSSFGWDILRVRTAQAGAQVLFRRLPFGFCVAYIAKGPVGNGWRDLWAELDPICKKKKAVFLRVEPDLWEPCPEDRNSEFPGFIPGLPIQPRRTILIDLDGDEDTWMTRMKQKTRYNIRLAEKKGVLVRETDDISTFASLMLQTGKRDGFGVHSRAYYQRAYDLFAPSGKCALLFAEYESKPLGALMVFAEGNRAWYLYGASSDEERNRMPPYLLQWRAMQWAAAKGCATYDLWGIPDYDIENLEAQFTHRPEGLWGVYRFKRGFGGRMVQSGMPRDRVYQPTVYRFYRWVLQRRGV